MELIVARSQDWRDHEQLEGMTGKLIIFLCH